MCTFFCPGSPMMGSRSLVALILGACMHRSPATPSPAVSPAVSVAEGESTALSQPAIRGFVDIEEHCHWVHLDAATGEVLRSRPLPTQNCPNRAIVNTSTAGTTLMAVHFAEHNELWLQRGANAEIMEIVGDPHLEMAWEASGRVYATTVDFKMGHVVEWPDLNTVSTMPIDEEREADNHRDCYTYAWSEGPTTSEPTWELIREETIERQKRACRRIVPWVIYRGPPPEMTMLVRVPRIGGRPTTSRRCRAGLHLGHRDTSTDPKRSALFSGLR